MYTTLMKDLDNRLNYVQGEQGNENSQYFLCNFSIKFYINYVNHNFTYVILHKTALKNKNDIKVKNIQLGINRSSLVQGSYMYLPRFRFFLYLALISQFWSYSKAGYLLHARVIAFNSLDIIMSILTYMHHFPDKSHGIPELIFINFDCLDLCRVTASEATTVAGL